MMMINNGDDDDDELGISNISDQLWKFHSSKSGARLYG